MLEIAQPTIYPLKAHFVTGEAYANDPWRHIHKNGPLVRRLFEKLEHRFDLVLPDGVDDGDKKTIYEDPHFVVYKRGLFRRNRGVYKENIPTGKENGNSPKVPTRSITPRDLVAFARGNIGTWVLVDNSGKQTTPKKIPLPQRKDLIKAA